MITKMASIIIRNLDDALKAKLRVRAARQGRSMEEEVRIILTERGAIEKTLVNVIR
jgi:plasmid stability protein